MTFKLHDATTAPDASIALLQASGGPSGRASNVERVMAESPELLEAFATAYGLFGRTSLSAIEQQVVAQTANYENICEYCMPWHTTYCIAAGMAPGDVTALRENTPLSSPRLEALRHFTRSLIQNRGKISPAERDAFFAAGFAERQALDVVLGLAMKLMTNYTNSIAGTPLDEKVRRHAWSKPGIAMGSLGSE